MANACINSDPKQHSSRPVFMKSLTIVLARAWGSSKEAPSPRENSPDASSASFRLTG